MLSIDVFIWCGAEEWDTTNPSIGNSVRPGTSISVTPPDSSTPSPTTWLPTFQWTSELRSYRHILKFFSTISFIHNLFGNVSGMYCISTRTRTCLWDLGLSGSTSITSMIDGYAVEQCPVIVNSIPWIFDNFFFQRSIYYYYLMNTSRCRKLTEGQ